MIPMLAATHLYLGTLVDSAFEQVENMPDDDINAWRPALGLEDINTFYALLTHLVSSGEFWLLSVAAERPTSRVRSQEFVATGDVAAVRARSEQWLDDVRAFFETLDESDLGRTVDFRDSSTGQPDQTTVADCIAHALEHTAMHVGHLQLQRQIWNTERAAGR